MLRKSKLSRSSEAGWDRPSSPTACPRSALVFLLHIDGDEFESDKGSLVLPHGSWRPSIRQEACGPLHRLLAGSQQASRIDR